MKANSITPVLPENGTEERFSRIVTAALEVFTECSFQDATTEEIARRARVSKRDLYARFPHKNSLMIAVINMVLQEDNENIANVISLTSDSSPLSERLEVIGLALIDEVLSPAMGFLARLIPSESIGQPMIGTIYFENGYIRRRKLIADVLSIYLSGTPALAIDIDQAAEHYLALVTHLPSVSTLVGMREMWNPESAQVHVKGAVGSFLRAYPSFI
jgi:TetR/AcrR family transcriptional regulator, mexJK operon transcriptional repressor